MAVISDPRLFPCAQRAADRPAARWHALVELEQSATTGPERNTANAALHAELVAALSARDVSVLVEALDTAPSAVCYRQLLRGIDAAWADPAVDGDASIVAHGFAVPVVLVAASDEPVEHPLELGEPGKVVSLLRDHGALAGNAAVAISNALAGAADVGVRSLTQWLARRAAGVPPSGSWNVERAPLHVEGGQEGAHLRFVVGSALAAPGARVVAGDRRFRWGRLLARQLSEELAAPGLQILALPRPPAAPAAALRAGQQAQREIALSLFASNAIRTLRANFGEPSAVISAHLGADGGELRLSLSSVFGERDAEGFRCPLFPYDRIDDVLAAIVELLRSCRISDIRVLDGVQPDHDPVTRGPLFFRSDAIGTGNSTPFH